MPIEKMAISLSVCQEVSLHPRDPRTLACTDKLLHRFGCSTANVAAALRSEVPAGPI